MNAQNEDYVRSLTWFLAQTNEDSVESEEIINRLVHFGLPERLSPLEILDIGAGNGKKSKLLNDALTNAGYNTNLEVVEPSSLQRVQLYQTYGVNPLPHIYTSTFDSIQRTRTVNVALLLHSLYSFPKYNDDLVQLSPLDQLLEQGSLVIADVESEESDFYKIQQALGSQPLKIETVRRSFEAMDVETIYEGVIVSSFYPPPLSDNEFGKNLAFLLPECSHANYERLGKAVPRDRVLYNVNDIIIGKRL